MDKWQNHVLDKVRGFVDEDFEYTENEVTISMNQREAYVVMKALECQRKCENPLVTIDMDDPVEIVRKNKIKAYE